MIVQVHGRILSKELDRVELMTSGGIAYEILIPLNVYESVGRPGDDATLWTSLIVREDGWQLYGFASAYERRIFNKVLGAKGVGPALALGMLSTLTAERVVRAIREKDVATLQSVPRVGRKKAEQMILDLADKLEDAGAPTDGAPRPAGLGVDDAIRALVSLGYSTADAEKAVRAALDAGKKGMSAPELIRAALAKIGGR
ncbi:MAG TPA: Holliday junction branch migration protein RuvA [Gemmatimonadaceae bacterium]|nr:Holliday junction branch migration protein RuvA [Gemmatimonadaceae bacterium]